MTIFGPDISSYESLSVAALTDPFVIAKVSEGTYYRDANWPAWRDQARAAGKILVGYHFVTNEAPTAQAVNCAAHLGDAGIPLMLDFEPEGAMRPSLPQLLAVADAFAARGLRVRLAYVPRWYWQQIGSPDLSGLRARRIGLVSSAYPNTSIPAPAQNYAADGGDSGPGWQPYGGMTPTLWQFTDAGLEQQRIDFNAYCGTAAELAAFLGTDPTPGGISMGQIPPSIAQKWPDLAGDFPPDAQFTDETALIWADAGARAAALYALEARDAVNALAAKLSAPPAVDVQALAADLAPLLTAGATPDQVAQAVVAHLAATLAKS